MTSTAPSPTPTPNASTSDSATADPGIVFDGWGLAPPREPWAYELDDYGITYGPGWWPWHRESRPASVRLSPDTEYRAWRNWYVGVSPDSTGPTGRAYFDVFVQPRGMGADVVASVHVDLDLRQRTATVQRQLPPELAERAQHLADKILAAVLAARRERRRGVARPITAHERYIARQQSSAAPAQDPSPRR